MDQTGTAYIGNFEYKTYWNVPLYITLKKVFHSEGYVDEFSNNQTYCGYVYFRKDHLGNNREVWRAGKAGGTAATTLQRTWYYPSGLPWNYTTGTGASVQAYKYNSKEFIEMHGFDSYDYSARMMYPAIGGRFMTVDPLAEDYYEISPYAYCANNPIRFTDPDGRKIYMVTGNKMVLASAKEMQRTEIGKALWDKYNNSKTDDIYLTSQQFKRVNAGGYAYANAQKYSIIHDGKIKLDLNDPNQSDMSNLNGLDVSKSDGRNIHLVNINNNTASKDGNYGDIKFNGDAYAIFHEIDAHIEKDRTYNSELGHELHGYSLTTKVINGKEVQAISIKKDSDAWKMIMQLIELRKNENDTK